MHATINLLPWREQKRQQKKKRFIHLFVLLVLFAISTVFFSNYLISCYLNNQLIRNQLLQKEMVIFDKKIKEIKELRQQKKALFSKIALLRHLHSLQILTVHLFDELIKVTPTGIYLTKIQDINKAISVTGYAESNKSISELMKNIEQDPWFHEPVLKEIKKMDDKELFVEHEFTLTFILGAARYGT